MESYKNPKLCKTVNFGLADTLIISARVCAVIRQGTGASSPCAWSFPPSCKAAFTRQTKVGKLVLVNSSWCVWTAQKQSAYTWQTVGDK